MPSIYADSDWFARVWPKPAGTWPHTSRWWQSVCSETMNSSATERAAERPAMDCGRVVFAVRGLPGCSCGYHIGLAGHTPRQGPGFEQISPRAIVGGWQICRRTALAAKRNAPGCFCGLVQTSTLGMEIGCGVISTQVVGDLVNLVRGGRLRGRAGVTIAGALLVCLLRPACEPGFHSPRRPRHGRSATPWLLRLARD
jgi:hypothetical protein